MITTFTLEYGFAGSDGDPAMALTDAQKALFPPDFIAGTGNAIYAVINAGAFVITCVLEPGLGSHHPWYPEHWALYFNFLSFTPFNARGNSFGASDVTFDISPFLITQNTNLVGTATLLGTQAPEGTILYMPASDFLGTATLETTAAFDSFLLMPPGNFLGTATLETTTFFDSYLFIPASNFSCTGRLVANNNNAIAIAYNTENKAISCLNNMAFLGSCVFNGKTLLFNEQGLFELSGHKDDIYTITPSLKTGKLNFGSQRLKQLQTPKVYVEANKQNGELTLNVTADNENYTYTNDTQRDGEAVYPIIVGRGLRFNEITLELTATNTEQLTIESIELDPIEIQRRDR